MCKHIDVYHYVFIHVLKSCVRQGDGYTTIKTVFGLELQWL